MRIRALPPAQVGPRHIPSLLCSTAYRRLEHSPAGGCQAISAVGFLLIPKTRRALLDGEPGAAVPTCCLHMRFPTIDIPLTEKHQWEFISFCSVSRFSFARG